MYSLVTVPSAELGAGVAVGAMGRVGTVVVMGTLETVNSTIRGTMLKISNTN
jgi:hypothetical protein